MSRPRRKIGKVLNGDEAAVLEHVRECHSKRAKRSVVSGLDVSDSSDSSLDETLSEISPEKFIWNGAASAVGSIGKGSRTNPTATASAARGCRTSRLLGESVLQRQQYSNTLGLDSDSTSDDGDCKATSASVRARQTEQSPSKHGSAQQRPSPPTMCHARRHKSRTQSRILLTKQTALDRRANNFVKTFNSYNRERVDDLEDYDSLDDFIASDETDEDGDDGEEQHVDDGSGGRRKECGKVKKEIARLSKATSPRRKMRSARATSSAAQVVSPRGACSSIPKRTLDLDSDSDHDEIGANATTSSQSVSRTLSGLPEDVPPCSSSSSDAESAGVAASGRELRTSSRTRRSSSRRINKVLTFSTSDSDTDSDRDLLSKGRSSSSDVPGQEADGDGQRTATKWNGHVAQETSKRLSSTSTLSSRGSSRKEVESGAQAINTRKSLRHQKAEARALAEDAVLHKICNSASAETMRMLQLQAIEEDVDLKDLVATGATSGHDAILATNYASAEEGDDGADDLDDDDFIVDDDEVEQDFGLVSCICHRSDAGYRGLWMQCSQELCGAWMHAACFGYQTKAEIPRRILCTKCKAFLRTSDRPRRKQLKASETSFVQSSLKADQASKRSMREKSEDCESDSESDTMDLESAIRASAEHGVTSSPNVQALAQERFGQSHFSASQKEAKKVDPDDAYDGVHDQAEVFLTSPKQRASQAHRSPTKLSAIKALKMLFKVCENGDVEVVSKMIKSGANVNGLLAGNQAKTPLMTAASNGNHAVLQALLENGANPTAIDIGNATALVFAIRNGHSVCASSLIKVTSSKDLAFVSVEEGNLLHLTAGTGATSLLDTLLKRFEHGVVKELILAENSEGCIPLQSALLNGFYPTTTRLLSTIRSHDLNIDINMATMLPAAILGGSMECFETILRRVSKTFLNRSDSDGFAAIHHAASEGQVEMARALISAGCRVDLKDKTGATPLHLAALSGSTPMIDLIVTSGHPLDVQDNLGWPPLLYADFSASEECVLHLMRTQSVQLAKLGTLLQRYYPSEEQRDRTRAQVISVITSLATHNAFYREINRFFKTNFELLEDDEFKFLLNIKGLIDFENKSLYIQKRLKQLAPRSCDRASIGIRLIRDDVLTSLYQQLDKYNWTQLADLFLSVTFINEPGVCLGPFREMWSLLGDSIVKCPLRLFEPCNESNSLKFLPLSMKCPSPEATSHLQQLRCRMFSFIGAIVGVALHRGEFVELDIVAPMLARVLRSSQADGQGAIGQGQEGETKRMNATVEDLQAVDPTSMSSLNWLQHASQEDIASLELTFSKTVQYKQLTPHDTLNIFSTYPQSTHGLESVRKSRHNAQSMHSSHSLTHPCQYDAAASSESIMVDSSSDAEDADKDDSTTQSALARSTASSSPSSTIISRPISSTIAAETVVCQQNRDAYVAALAEYTVHGEVSQEVTAFRLGLQSVVPADLLEMLSATEFSLMLCGPVTLNVADWKENTHYTNGYSRDSKVVVWFWRVVQMMTEEERRKLLSFCTGCTKPPPGGFSALRGLSGEKFTISQSHDSPTQLPTASTCFNLLKLPLYKTFEDLQRKLLCAVRYGAQGFAFS
eukprot:m.338822 g.338822  ORF g.338822 m.338822 type:complete len:1591 (+) comp16087_c0_seq1:142-4914(+)